MQISIWGIPEKGRDLQALAQPSGSSDHVKGAAWSSADDSSIASISGNKLTIWRLGEGVAEVQTPHQAKCDQINDIDGLVE